MISRDVRLSLFETHSSEFASKGNQSASLTKHSTEVFFLHTSRSSFLPLARLPQIHPRSPLPRFAYMASAPLCSCSGADRSEGIKKPRRLERHIGTVGLRLGTRCVLIRRCLGSSMLPLSRCDGRGLLIAPLAQRSQHYTPSSSDATTHPLGPGPEC